MLLAARELFVGKFTVFGCRECGLFGCFAAEKTRQVERARCTPGNHSQEWTARKLFGKVGIFYQFLWEI